MKITLYFLFFVSFLVIYQCTQVQCTRYCKFREVNALPGAQKDDRKLRCHHRCCINGCTYVLTKYGVCQLHYSPTAPTVGHPWRMYHHHNLEKKAGPVCNGNWTGAGQSCYQVLYNATAHTRPEAAAVCATLGSETGVGGRLGVCHTHTICNLATIPHPTLGTSFWVGAQWTVSGYVWDDSTPLPQGNDTFFSTFSAVAPYVWWSVSHQLFRSTTPTSPAHSFLCELY